MGATAWRKSTARLATLRDFMIDKPRVTTRPSGAREGGEPAQQVIPVRQVETQEGFEFVARRVRVFQSEIGPNEQLSGLDVSRVQAERRPASIARRAPVTSLKAESCQLGVVVRAVRALGNGAAPV